MFEMWETAILLVALSSYNISPIVPTEWKMNAMTALCAIYENRSSYRNRRLRSRRCSDYVQGRLDTIWDVINKVCPLAEQLAVSEEYRCLLEALSPLMWYQFNQSMFYALRNIRHYRAMTTSPWPSQPSRPRQHLQLSLASHWPHSSFTLLDVQP